MQISNLTLKQEKFCREFILTGNQSEAYRRAYRADSMLSKTVHECASRLMKNRKVAARVQELQKEAQQEYRQSRDDLLRELDKNREMALMNVGNVGTMNAATMGKARLLGYLDSPSGAQVITETNRKPRKSDKEIATSIVNLLGPIEE